MPKNLMPPEGQSWLRAVGKELGGFEPSQRREIVDGLRAHILDALDTGERIEVVLQRLGAPAAVARQAISESDQVGPDAPERFLTAPRAVQMMAFGLVVIAAIVIGFLPSESTVTLDDGSLTSTTVTNFQNIAMLSPSFVIAMVLALFITAAPLVTRGRTWQIASIVAAALMAVVTIASIVLIGNWPLLPAAIASLIAWLVPADRGRPGMSLVAGSTSAR